jgi:hypothetical protein
LSPSAGRVLLAADRMRHSWPTLAFVVACASAPTPAEPAGALEPVAFLAGEWTATTAEGDVREAWGPPRGNAMLGTSHTVAGGRTLFFEYVRIEARSTGLVYLASPLGRHPPTAFALVESDRDRVVFENPEHDFPQRVVYERNGDRLDASIEGNDNGKVRTESWSYQRVK